MNVLRNPLPRPYPEWDVQMPSIPEPRHLLPEKRGIRGEEMARGVLFYH